MHQSFYWMKPLQVLMWKNETKVQEALSRLLKNKTVLVIAHRMRTVQSADKIVVLENGRVKEQGDTGTIIC